MFEKNLEHINNVALKRRLEKMSPVEARTGITYCITPSNDYILLKDDVPTDDLKDPRKAAKDMLKNNIKSEMRPNDIIINFGIGLGYLLDETFNTYPSKIYVYEPDINMLHFVLSNVDFSEHLSSGRVYLTNDLDELIAKLSNEYITKDKIEIVYLQNYAIVRNKELLMLTQKVYDTCKSKMIDINTIAKFTKVWLDNTVNNIASVNSGTGYLFSDLENKFNGQTAVVAGAGPSLNDNIAYIQANRNKFTLFAVNKVVKYLLLNGITPDFVVCLDASNMIDTLGDLKPQLARANCLMDIRTDKAVLNLGFNKCFINFSESDFIAKKLSAYNPFIKFSEAGGSASTFALVSAIKMGFSKVILAGVDLAFKENVMYANGDIIQRVSQDKIVADHITKNIVQVRSVNGNMVNTRDDYESFIQHFANLIKDYNYNEVYNVSSFGADIPGTHNVRFEDLQLVAPAVPVSLESMKQIKFNVKEFMDEEFKNINNVIEMLSKGVFSPALVSSIVKSVFIYQYMQSEIVTVLQKNFEPGLAEEFINNTKTAIKTVVELLQKCKLI